MNTMAKLGAAAFAGWGLLHIAGGLFILSTTLGSGATSGYAIYGYGGEELPDVTGAILAYFAYLLALIGCVSLAIALRWNWRNSETALAMNTGLILATELGLIAFLILPGHLSFAEALPGFVLFALGATLGGVACRKDPAHAE